MVTNIGNPGDFNPVYNPLVYYFNSTNKNQLGFRYIVEVFFAGTTDKIAEFRIAPRPVDGYGYCDLTSILKNLVTYDFNPASTTSFIAANSSVKYDLKIGEEYVVNYNIISFTQVGGYTRITTAANTFVVNDQVVIADPLVSGLFTVITDTSTTQITIDLPWNAAYSATATGTIAYADNRKTVTRNLLSYTNQVAYNSAFSFADFRTYNATDYKIIATSTTKKMLTDMPSGHYMYSSQDMWVNYAPFGSSVPVYMYFQNSNGDILRKTISITGTESIRMVSTGPNNAGTLSVVSGTAGLIKSTTTYYEFWITNTSGTQMTQKYRINILNDCKIENYEILFLDRKGSMVSFPFELRSKITTSSDMDMYNNQVGQLMSGKFGYNSYDRWSTTTNVKLDTQYELNTNWFRSDAQLTYFNQLLTSPLTMIKIDGLYYQCVVQEKNDTINQLKNKTLQQKSVKVKVINEIINV